MTRALFTLIIFSFSLNSFASSGEIDSLKQLYITAQNAGEKTDLALELSASFLDENRDSNLHYLNIAKANLTTLNIDSLELKYLVLKSKRYSRDSDYPNAKQVSLRGLEKARHLGSRKFELSFNMMLSSIYYYLGAYDTSFSYYSNSYGIASELKDSSSMSSASLGQSICMIAGGEYEKALALLLTCAELSERLKDYNTQSLAEFYKGYMYYYLERYPESKKHYEKSLEIRKRIGNTRGVSYCLVSIASVEEAMGDYDEAIAVYKDALVVLKKVGIPLAITTTYESIGASYRRLENYQMSKSYLDSALTLAKQHQLSPQLISVYGQFAQLYAELDQWQLVKKNALAANELGKEIGNNTNYHKNIYLLSRAYIKTGEVDLGLQLQDEYIAHKDSISESNLAAKVLEIESQFELNQKEKLLLQQDAQLAQQHLILQKSQSRWTITIGICLLLVVLVIFFYRAYKLKSKAKEQQEKLNAQLKSSNEKLKELNVEKNNLIGIVAHDLKSPFHNIIGLTQVLEAKSELTDEQKKILEMVRGSAYSVEDMINHILDLNKIESNLLNLDLNPVNLSNISKLIVERFQFTAENKKIRLKSDIAEEVYALANANYFNQVVENILSNAFKFSEHNSEVEVSLQDFEDHVLLEIKDKGPGIAEEFKSKVFEPNVTGNAKPTGDEKSTGIGLAIVKRFVDSMGGDVWFDSELGKGTSFYVKLNKAA